MKYHYLAVLMIFIMVLLPCSSVLAWYQTDEIDNNWDRTYMNVRFGTEDMYRLELNKTMVKPNWISNLEPGYFLNLNREGDYIQKRSATDGSVIWERVAGDGLGSIPDTYQFMPAIDSNYDIYIAADGKLVKLDGSDGHTLWTTSNMNGIASIMNMWINPDSSMLLVLALNVVSSSYAIFETDDGNRISSSAAPGDCNDVVWTADDRIIFFKTNDIEIRDVYFFEVESYSATYYYTLYQRVLVGDNNPVYKEFIFANDKSKVVIYEYDDDTLTELCDYTTTNGSHGDMCYSPYADRLLIQHTNNQADHGPSSVIMLNWTKEDPTNITKVWESAQQDNTHTPMGYAIMDKYGYVLWHRYGNANILRLDAINGATIQNYATSSYELYAPNIGNYESVPIIYDSASENLIATSVESSSYSHLTWARYNSTYSSGGNEDPVFPEELTESEWTWLFFTFCIISLAAVAAFIGGYVFNRSVFMLVLSVLVSIGAWYGIYPVEVILLAVLGLFSIYISKAGDSYE